MRYHPTMQHRRPAATHPCGVVLIAFLLAACGRSGSFPTEITPLAIEPLILQFAVSVGEVATPVTVVLSGVESPDRSWEAVAGAPWVLVDPESATGVTTAQVTVATRDLSPGAHTSTVRFDIVEDEVAVESVTMAVQLILTAPGWTSLDGPYVGELTAVAVDPVDDQHVLAGSYRGRLFVSTDGGDTFEFLTRLDGGHEINEIALTASGRAYAATDGSGVFVSTDGGTSWAASGLQNVDLGSLAVSEIDDLHALATGEGSVWQTTDGGDTWNPTDPGESPALVERNPQTPGEFFVSANNGVFYVTDGVTFEEKISASSNHVTSVVVPPNDEWLVTNYCSDRADSSTDQGATWTSTGAGLPGSTLRLMIDGSYVWAFGTHGAYRSEDDGASFILIPFGFRPEDAYIRRGRVHPDGALFAHRSEGILRYVPDTGLVPMALFGDEIVDIELVPATGRLYGVGDRGTVFVWTASGGFESLAGTGMDTHDTRSVAPDPRSSASLCIANYGDYAIQCSDDGGLTWNRSALGLDGYSHRLIRVPGDPDVLWISTNAGLYRSTDNGLSFSLMPLAAEYSGYHLAVVSRNVVLASGSSTGSRLGRFDATTGTTDVALGGDHTPTLVRRTADGSFWYGSFDLGLHRSEDGGVTFTPYGPLSDDARDVEVDPTQPSRVYLATSTGLFLTNDGGVTWTELGAPFGVRTLDVDPASGEIYAGTYVGGIYRYAAP